MKKGYYRAMVALLAAPLVGAALVGCDKGGSGEVESLYEKVEFVNKNALSAEWHVGDATRTVELKVTKKDGTVLEGMDLDDLYGDKLVVTSSNESVVKVGNDTILTVQGVGTAVITVTLDGKLTDSVSITTLAWVDTITEGYTRVTEAKAGTFKFGSKNYELGRMHYLKGLTIPQNTYYFEGVENFAEACEVTVAEIPGATDDYKWSLKVGDQYIGIATSHNSNGDHANDASFADTTTATTHWKWDATYQTFVSYVTAPAEWTEKQSGDYYLGMYTKKNYTTFSMLPYADLTEASVILSGAGGLFPGHMYEIPEVMVVVNPSILIIKDIEPTAQISVSKAQGDVTYTVKSGEGATVSATGLVTATENGTVVIAVSDGVTSIDVTVTIRDHVKGEMATDPLTASEAYDKANALASGSSTTEYYYVSGIISDTPTATYCNFHMTDDGNTGTKSFYVYGLIAAGESSDAYGSKKQIAEIPFYCGDSMVIRTQLKRYNSDREGVNAKLISYTNNDVAVTSSGENATVTFTSGVTEGKAKNGTTVTFTVAPSADFEIENVKIYNSEVTASEGVYSFTVKGPATVVVKTKAAGTASEAQIASINLTSDISGTGGSVTTACSTKKTGYYQDYGTIDESIAEFKVLNTSAYWSAIPTSITFKANLGGGSNKDPLGHNVEVVLLDASGNEISGTKVTVTTKVTTTSTEYSVSIPTDDTLNCAGFKLTHLKEDGFNVRYYSMSLLYVAAPAA